MKSLLDYAWEKFQIILEKDQDNGLTSNNAILQEFISNSDKIGPAIRGLTNYLTVREIFETDSWWENEKSCSSSMLGLVFL